MLYHVKKKINNEKNEFCGALKKENGVLTVFSHK